MIAMEALLSDGNQEMTYKVAMRLAGLYKIVAPERASDAFRELKLIYRFRSKVVRGVTDSSKPQSFQRAEGAISFAEAAMEHLRTAFEILIAHLELLDPARVDAYLITGQL